MSKILRENQLTNCRDITIIFTLLVALSIPQESPYCKNFVLANPEFNPNIDKSSTEASHPNSKQNCWDSWKQRIKSVVVERIQASSKTTTGQKVAKVVVVCQISRDKSISKFRIQSEDSDRTFDNCIIRLFSSLNNKPLLAFPAAASEQSICIFVSVVNHHGKINCGIYFVPSEYANNLFGASESDRRKNINRPESFPPDLREGEFKPREEKLKDIGTNNNAPLVER